MLTVNGKMVNRAMPLASGTRLGPYEILAPIGAGGMGEVYRARDTRLDRVVAVKVSTQQFSERFEREARAIAALNHPNICQLYDVGPDYLVMEYIEGKPVAGPQPLDTVLRYAIQIADGLDAAHRKGIAHRDLKPANILAAKSGIKILDFGLAKTAFADEKAARAPDETVTRALTGSQQIVGTLQYMSPEQLQPGVKDVDVRSDIFSFGLVLYELLTGKRAFDGPSAASIIAAILERPAPSVGAVAPPALDRVVKCCLAKDPDDRWQSARDLRRELEWIGSSPSAVETAPAGAVSGRRPWIYAGAVGIGLVAALAAIWWLQRPATQTAMPRFKAVIETPQGENWLGPKISSDGTKIAFGTSKGIRVRTIDSLEPQPVVHSAGTPLAWSPDCRYLLEDPAPGAGYRKIEVPGGEAQMLVQHEMGERGASWGPGIILFSKPGSLQRIAEDGGESAPVTNFESFYPQFLPDGKHFLFLGAPLSTEEGIYIGSLDSKTTRKLTKANSQAEYCAGHLIFMRGTSLMAQTFDPRDLRLSGEPVMLASDAGIFPVSHEGFFSASANGVLVYQTGSVGRTVLTWMDRSGKPLGVLDDTNLNLDVEVSPDGKSAAIARTDPKTLNTNLWITDLKRGITSRATSGTGEVQPSWSPDSRKIAYAENRLTSDEQTRYGIRVMDVAGTGESTPVAENASAPHWSPDGSRIVAKEGRGGPGSLCSVSAAGGGNPERYLEGQFFQPAYSPDGRWMAYVSPASGDFEVYVQSVPAGHGKWQISTHGGTQPVWRQDGKELFYYSRPDIVAAPVKIGSTFEAGTPKALFRITTGGLPYFRRQYSVSPDGQRFLVVQAVDEKRQTIMLYNWFTEGR
jgi:Tol biopolymer transport system component/predicted Ser/Thr protein kinase